MKTHRFLRWAACVLPALVIPSIVACEAVLDFDRTPLQPVYEASVPGTDATSGGEGGKSSSTSSSTGGSSTSSTSSSSSSSGGEPQDAGPDADSGGQS